MVTGQAVVLYSRLHLVFSDMRKVRWVLWMIITNACILHIPMTVFFFGLNRGDARFARPAAIFDRIQSTVFCIQDFVIWSYIYIKRCIISRVPLQSAVATAATPLSIYFASTSSFVKLKLEFSVLNRLRLLTSTNPCICQHGPEDSRRSNDKNIFGMASSRPVIAPDVSSQSGATQTICHVRCDQAASMDTMKRYARRRARI
ncbi:unnamed protein product [Penicillium nalgiovense]|nr:unnamed protein product [Penicillium nalgiovense]